MPQKLKAAPFQGRSDNHHPAEARRRAGYLRADKPGTKAERIKMKTPRTQSFWLAMTAGTRTGTQLLPGRTGGAASLTQSFA